MLPLGMLASGMLASGMLVSGMLALMPINRSPHFCPALWGVKLPPQTVRQLLFPGGLAAPPDTPCFLFFFLKFHENGLDMTPIWNHFRVIFLKFPKAGGVRGGR